MTLMRLFELHIFSKNLVFNCDRSTRKENSDTYRDNAWKLTWHEIEQIISETIVIDGSFETIPFYDFKEEIMITTCCTRALEKSHNLSNGL